MRGSFEELIAEGGSVDTTGWDFSWFAGRATEERPPWGYASRLAARLAEVDSALDVQTGGGEVFAWALERSGRPPATVLASESYPPNAELARRSLAGFGAKVAEIADDAPLPAAGSALELVCSRHPVCTNWPEIARVLAPGGRYLSQQIGAGTNRELTEFVMGPRPLRDDQRSEAAAAAAESAGLVVRVLQEATLRVEFFDVAAVAHFLRKVCWTVPDFSVDRYREALLALHCHIERHGSFVSHARRFLIEAERR